MHTFIKYFMSLLAAAFFISGCQQKAADELLIHNARVYTMNEQMSTAQAIAVNDGRISWVGSNEEAQSRLENAQKVVDLNGQTLTPGFIESHGHLMALGEKLLNLDLTTCNTFEQMVAMVDSAAQQTEKGQWIIGRGWHQSKWEKMPENIVDGFPTHDALSAVSPDHPVYLQHANGHLAMANAKAMEVAGLNAKSKVEGYGQIVKNKNGQPTGVLHDDAMALVSENIPYSKQRAEKAMELAMQQCLKNGITTFRDAGTEARDLKLYQEYAKNNKLDIRLWLMIAGWDKELLDEWLEKEPIINAADTFFSVRAIKLSADGALGSRSAWLLEEYSDFPEHHGHATIDMEQVHEVALKSLDKGYQLCVHAIGDRANKEVLDQFEKAFEQKPEKANDHRFRIEHAQHLRPEDLSRFAELNIIASMQAIHMSSDRPWAIDRLGKERIEEGAYMWQTLLDKGVVIANGTDVPVEPVNPVACYYASVSRKTLEGTPEGGYEPAQKMNRMQALRSYTIDAAYAGFEEDIKGSVEVGKLADFTVFNQDIVEVAEDQLLDTEVTYTFVDGKVAYQK